MAASTATSSIRRLTSIPVAARRGGPYPAGATRAWISTASGAGPLERDGDRAAGHRRLLGLEEGAARVGHLDQAVLASRARPTSSVEPYRFLAARSRRGVPLRSPSR